MLNPGGRQEETSTTGFFPNDVKKKRDEYTQDLRKGKREELLNDHRHRNLQSEQKMTGRETLEEDRKKENQFLDQLRTKWQQQIYMIDDFDNLIQKINSGDITMQLYGLIGVGQLFQRSEIIQKRIELDSVAQILRVVAKDDYYVLQKDGIRLISEVCRRRTDLIHVIIDSDGIPILLKLLKSECEEILLCTTLALSAIASNSTSNRDIILQEGGLNLILETVLQSNNLNLLKGGLQTVFALCHGKPPPPQRLVEPAIPVLCSLYLAHQDEDVMVQAAQSMVYATNTSYVGEQIINMGVVPKLINHMDHHNIALSYSCFRLVWELLMFVQGSSFIDTYASQVVPKVFKLTQSPRIRLKREACWFLLTFIKRSSRNTQIIIENSYYVDMLIKLAISFEQNVANGACRALSNAIKNIGANMLEEVLELGILECFIYHLQKSDSQIVLEPILTGILTVMDRAATIIAENGQNSSSDRILKLIEDKKVIQHIRGLQSRQVLNENCKKTILLINSRLSKL